MVSNATRWDTFEAMMGEDRLPPSEAAFRKRYQKSPSFLSIHMGVRAELLPEVRTPHHKGRAHTPPDAPGMISCISRARRMHCRCLPAARARRNTDEWLRLHVLTLCET